MAILIPIQPMKLIKKVAAFLSKQINASHAVLLFYLSPELTKRFNILATLKEAQHSDIKIQQLASVYQTASNKLIAYLLDMLAYSIGLLNNQSLDYTIYHDNDSVSGKQNILIPYYLIGQNDAMLLSADGNASYLVT